MTIPQQSLEEKSQRYEGSLINELFILKSAGITLSSSRKPALVLVDGWEYRNKDERVQISRLSEEDPHLEVTFERRNQSLSALLGCKIHASGEISVTLQDDEGYVHTYKILRDILKQDTQAGRDPRQFDLSSIYQP
jgi:hypothetical protein